MKIAVSVPIGSNLNIAQEILRGAAQAQDEVNNSGGINGIPLKLVIANDRNKPEISAQVATEFTNDNTIIAVMGHNFSEAANAAADGNGFTQGAKGGQVSHPVHASEERGQACSRGARSGRGAAAAAAAALLLNSHAKAKLIPLQLHQR